MAHIDIFDISESFPLTDDIWLGMQLRNIPIVDFTIIREIEGDALSEYMKRDRTPVDILLVLSAQSQMWIFALYEFLRTWRQRARFLLDVAKEIENLTTTEADAKIAKIIDKQKQKESNKNVVFFERFAVNSRLK